MLNRRALQEWLRSAREKTDALFGLLAPKAYLERPIPERHRLVFYLGHLEAFDWNLVCRDCLGRPSIDAGFERLFAFGIDPIGGGLPSDRPSEWPSLEQVRAYCAKARAEVDAAVDTAPLAGWLEDGWALRMAIEHRLMHAETLCYMLHRLPCHLKRPAETASVSSAPPPPRRQVLIPAGRATLGLSRALHPHLGWDNEYEEHSVEVPAFRIDVHKVTNGDFLHFVDAGGYAERSFWSEEDWAWRCAAGVARPAFWSKREGHWLWRGMFAEVPLPLSWAVYVSHAEASAYARSAGAALPTEAQWHRAALGAPDAQERRFPWGDAEPVPGRHGSLGDASFEPAPVGGHPEGQSAFGVHDLLGNGWEWTSTRFAPFAGFTPLPFYKGYSSDFFDGRHWVMKGASARTDVGLIRRSFRNWFQAHYPYVYAGFRCVKEA